jgi:hypothetical protein
MPIEGGLIFLYSTIRNRLSSFDLFVADTKVDDFDRLMLPLVNSCPRVGQPLGRHPIRRLPTIFSEIIEITRLRLSRLTDSSSQPWVIPGPYLTPSTAVRWGLSHFKWSGRPRMSCRLELNALIVIRDIMVLNWPNFRLISNFAAFHQRL